MRSMLLLAAALLVVPVSALQAQEPDSRQRRPAATQQGDDSAPRVAVPRGEPAGQSSPPPAQRPAPPTRSEPSEGGQGTAQPRRSRPRGDNPQTGVAVPRGSVPAPPAGRTTLVYYPRLYYPYGYGAFGLGYFYYDPYGWYPGQSLRFSGYGYGYLTGKVRLRVEPREAEVYVDGYYAGLVDDFDGRFQGLRLEEGPYTIEIVAPDHEPLEFRIRIQPGRTITYRGELQPRP